MTAPSITIPAGHNSDRLLAVFATPNSTAITLPGAVSGRWNFHAIGFGISAAMGDTTTPSGATGNYVALREPAPSMSVRRSRCGPPPARRR